MLAKCCKEKDIKRELPISESTAITFILWLANDRQVKASTINSYLSGVRQLHIMKALEPPKIRTDLVNLVLRGKNNKDNAAKSSSGTQERQPVTPDILLLIKARLKSSRLNAMDQRLIWAVCSICFFGAFRGAELLSRSEKEFDPAYTLLAEDIQVNRESNGTESLQFKIKAPKEDKKGKSVIIDVYPSREDICPVAAFRKWCALHPPINSGQPAFRWSNGTPLTSRRLNKILQERLTGYLEGAERFYTVHSFRTGAASMMAALGFTDSEIQAMGKWSSMAFENYVKLPRSKRRAVAMKFSNQFM